METSEIAYQYDGLSRLTEANYSDGRFFHYEYDANGNRTAETTQQGRVESVYDVTNRLVSVGGVAYTWDDNGNLTHDGTRSYSYDHANRLVSVAGGGETTSFAYNGLGDRLVENETQFGMDLNSGLTQALSDGTNTYLYGNERIGQFTANDSAYFLGDALGSVRQLVDGAGKVTMTKRYEPYGEALSTAGYGASAYGFTGEWNDAYIKLLYLRARFYSPVTGRFQTKDIWEGYYSRPLSLNQWGYVYANPIRLTDPSGRMPACEYPYEDCSYETSWDTYERFDIVLAYMHQEMIRNAQSSTVEHIKDLLTCEDFSLNPSGEFIAALGLWALKVRPGGVWDHKPKLAKKVELAAEGDYYFPIRDDREHEYYYDIWSNIHFGFVGAAAGLGLGILNFGASIPLIAGANDQGDILSVTIGFDLWETHKLSLTSLNLHQAILSNRENYLDISQRYDEVERVILWINGNGH